MRTRSAVTDAVLGRCRELGFALAGIADAAPTHYAAELRQWLAAGKHGEMGYLEEHEAQFADPQRLLEGARAVICVADRYAAGDVSHEEARTSMRGRIARYARGCDYHVVMKRRLHQLCDELAQVHPRERFRACVDTAPLLEREYAQRAGLGAIGKHTLLIEPGVGSYLLLGEVLTTLPLTPSDAVQRDVCGTCRRCIEACPTNAISLFSVDATKCISYLTICLL